MFVPEEEGDAASRAIKEYRRTGKKQPWPPEKKAASVKTPTLNPSQLTEPPIVNLAAKKKKKRRRGRDTTSLTSDGKLG